MIPIGTMVKKYIDIDTTFAYGIVIAYPADLKPYVEVHWFKAVGPKILRKPPYMQIEFCGMLELISSPP